MAIKEVTITMALPYHLRPVELKGAAASIGYDGPDELGQPRDISETLFRQAVNAKYGQGMPRTESRLWAQIMEQFDKREPTLTLPGDQFRFLHELTDRYDFPASFSRWRWLLLDEMERAKKAAEADSQPEAKES